MRSGLAKILAWGALLYPILGAGCANVVDGTLSTEIVAGSPRVERSPARPSLVLSARGADRLDLDDPPIADETFDVSAVLVEPVTVTTPQIRRSTRQIIPFSFLGELAEWPFTTVLGWIPLFEGTVSFGDYVDGINPAMNSPRFTQRREIETLSETPLPPKIEQRPLVRRVGGARIALGFPGLPKIQVTSAGDMPLSISLGALMTRPLADAPREIEAVVALDGSDETVRIRARLTPDLSDRLLRASRRSVRMDGSSVSDMASAILDLEGLGFPVYAKTLERDAATRHGADSLARAIADTHVRNARQAHARGDDAAAMTAIGKARARVTRGPREWDLLEADLHEAAALRAIEDEDYERARNGLLKASRLDRERQRRLASFLAIAIEAMDREGLSEQQARQTPSTPVAHALPAAAAEDTNASNVIEQCLAREAAIQACRLMPGFGKDLCKSSVRAKYAGVACP